MQVLALDLLLLVLDGLRGAVIDLKRGGDVSEDLDLKGLPLIGIGIGLRG